MPPRITEAQVRRALDRLAALRLDPPAQARAALELLSLPVSPGVLFACAAALEKHPLPEAHAAVVAAYQAVEADRKKLDSGGALRAALVRALRGVAVAGDAPLLCRAAATYEVTPNGPAALELRAAAAITLVDLDPGTAALVASRLLAEAADPARTSRLTGEPALTAARVLGALGRPEPLYLAATLDWSSPAEVVAECIRQLSDARATVLTALIDRLASTSDDTIQAALIDLLVAGEEGEPEVTAAAVAWLRTVSPDVYQFALTSLVASRRLDLHKIAAALVAEEFRRDRVAIAADALANARGSPTLLAAQQTMRERIGSA